MLSRRTLGIVALASVILAAISFAIVDVSIERASGCVGVAGDCPDVASPAIAIVFAVIGTIALLASIVPAFTWLAGVMNHLHADEPEPVLVRARAAFDDDL